LIGAERLAQMLAGDISSANSLIACEQAPTSESIRPVLTEKK
jgi:hypothetical protein